MDEKDLKKVYAEAGVDVPELEEEKEEESTKEPKESPKEEPKEKPQEPKKEGEEPKEPKEPLQDEPKEQRKRSIYDEYKDKKSELKTEKQMREQAEKERDELKVKLEALSTAGTPKEKQEAKDELEAFAKEINADPQALLRMRELFLKDATPKTDESLKRDLEEFKTWKSQNQHVVEKQLFDGEFQKVIPTLKEMFPKVSSEELEAVKEKLDVLSHTKEWYDKSLDYVAFKNKETLLALISPKKRGLESKGRKDIEEDSFEFDPEADYSKMTLKEREAWEANYAKMMKTEGLAEDSQGRKLLI